MRSGDGRVVPHWSRPGSDIDVDGKSVSLISCPFKTSQDYYPSRVRSLLSRSGQPSTLVLGDRRVLFEPFKYGVNGKPTPRTPLESVTVFR